MTSPAQSTLQQPERNAAGALTELERLWRRFSGERVLLGTGGRVTEISATHYRVRGLSNSARLGDVVEHRSPGGLRSGEIVQIGPDHILIAPFEPSAEAGVGDAVFNRGPFDVAPDASWRGRVINALTRPIDSGGELRHGNHRPMGTPAALSRARVGSALKTGVRAIDIFTPLCFGQRIGIFAGSGVGKSTLLAMLASADAFDTVVVTLVGERGREVREFLEDTIGHKNMAKTVAVVATSDESAMMRKRAPGTAMRVAEYFRDRGDRVLLVLDSITRFAHALREVATGAGEHPVARGYPASVFTDLPKLLERAGPGPIGGGSITAVISVLVDGDDHNDPVADSVRGILGETISADALQMARVRPGKPSTVTFAHQPAELVGKIATRTLLPGRFVPLSSVRQAYMVEQGASVQVLFVEGGLTISVKAITLQPGSAGDVVKVRNVDSGAVFSATVMADGTVRVDAS